METKSQQAEQSQAYINAISSVTTLLRNMHANGIVSQDLSKPLLRRVFPEYKQTDDDTAFLGLHRQLMTEVHEQQTRPMMPMIQSVIAAMSKTSPSDAYDTFLRLHAFLASIPGQGYQVAVAALHVISIYAMLCRAAGIRKKAVKQNREDHSKAALIQSRGIRLFKLILDRLSSDTTPYRDESAESLPYLALSESDAPHPERIVTALRLLRLACSDGAICDATHLQEARRLLKYSIPGLVLGYKHQSSGLVLANKETVLQTSALHHNITVRIRKFSERKWLKPLRALFPDTSPTDARHKTISVDHLVWRLVHGSKINPKLRPSACARPKDVINDINAILAHLPCGTNQILTMSCLISAVGAKESFAFQREYIVSNVLMADQASQLSRTKVLSQLHRKCAKSFTGIALTPRQVSTLAYLELAFGRSNCTSDWENEKRNRCGTVHHITRPKMPVLNQQGVFEYANNSLGDGHAGRDKVFYARLSVCIQNIVAKIMTKYQCQETFEDFYKRRHEWIASGSSAGYRLPHARALGNLAGLPANKRVWAENHGLEYMQQFMIENKPVELATASEKYENGKSRAIYGVVPEHYVINTYVTKGMEERLHLVPGLEKGASGLPELCYNVKRCRITDDPQQECTMLDYADFNIQHTPEAQAILFQVILEQGRQLGASRDWLNAASWLVRAKTNQQVLFPGDTKPSKVTQGMFSGTRSTDLINTILNLAYFQVADDYLRKSGVHPQQLYHVHQGDDVWLSNTNPLWARLLFYTMAEQGFIFQSSKQMFGSGRGEFLRVLYQHGRANGYLQRAVINYLLKPIQNSMTLGARDWAGTASETAMVLARRGLDIYTSTVLWEDMVSAYTKVKVTAADHRPVTVPLQLIATPVEFGGFGCSPPATVAAARTCAELPKMPKALGPLQGLHLESQMTDDWLAVISEKMYSTYPADVVSQFRSNTFKNTLVTDNYYQMVKNEVDRTDRKHLKRWLSDNRHLYLPDSQYRKEFLFPVNDPRQLVDVVTSNHAHAELPPITNSQYIANRIEYSMQSHQAAIETTRLRNSLSRLTASSIFKTESRLAQAFGIGKIQALRLIVQESMDKGRSDSELLSILVPLLRAGRSDIIELLQSGGASCTSSVATWLDAKYSNYIASMATEFVVLSCVYSGVPKSGNVFTQQWQTYSAMIRFLTQTPYPATSINY
nr:RdRp [Sogatella furcifera toti-like virus 2]